MAKCKYCHETISKLDKDICPFCGGLKPLEGVGDYTEDITKAFDPIKQDPDMEVNFKKKQTAGLLAIFLGIFGANFFYTKKNKLGFISLGVTLVLYLVMVLLYVFVYQSILFLILPYVALEIFYIYLGIKYFKSSDIKDGDGEFLR